VFGEKFLTSGNKTVNVENNEKLILILGAIALRAFSEEQIPFFNRSITVLSSTS
jgi:hypothetical protein